MRNFSDVIILCNVEVNWIYHNIKIKIKEEIILMRS